MDALLRQFSAHQRVRGFSERTVARREWSLGKWIDFLDREQVGPRPTGEHVELFLAQWPAPSSRYGVRSDLRQFYRYAIMRDLLDYDPTTKTEPPRLPKRAPTPLSAYHLSLLLSRATGPTRTMVLLGVFAGLRVSEIAALRGSDVRMSESCLVVRQGKGGKDRVVPLAPRLAIELASYGPGRLFPGVDGQGVSWRIRRLLRRLGIEARPHDLRHTFATEAARVADGNLLAVASLLGHSSVLTTQRYVQWVPQNQSIVTAMFRPPGAA